MLLTPLSILLCETPRAIPAAPHTKTRMINVIKQHFVQHLGRRFFGLSLPAGILRKELLSIPSRGAFESVGTCSISPGSFDMGRDSRE